VSSGTFLKAARLLEQWRGQRWHIQAQTCHECGKLATRSAKGGTVLGCDQHLDRVRSKDLPQAELVRETEEFIDQANDRPSSRCLPTGSGE
jgi:hypothetical protein